MQQTLPIEAARQLIEERGLKQSDLAIAIGCNQGQLSRLLRSVQTPTSKVYQQLSAYLISVSAGTDTASEALLIKALHRCWDGTPQHAATLERVLLSLAEYRESHG